MSLEQIKKRAKLFGVLTVAVLVLITGGMVYGLIGSALQEAPKGQDLHRLCAAALFAVGAVIMANAFLLLRSIWKSADPFQSTVISRFKRIGVLLMAFEPLQLLLQFISGYFEPIRMGESVVLSYNIDFLDGFVVVAGLIVLCTGYVFQYAAELQRQADETL